MPDRHAPEHCLRESNTGFLLGYASGTDEGEDGLIFFPVCGNDHAMRRTHEIY